MNVLKLTRNLLVLFAIVLLIAPGCKSSDLLEEGDRYLSMGNTTKAAEIYMQALKEGYDELVLSDRMKRIAIIDRKDSIHLKTAKNMMKNGDYLTAQMELNKALAIDSNNDNTKLLMARTHVKLSEFSAARLILDELSLASYDSSELNLLLAKCHYDRGDYHETKRYIQKSLTMQPDNKESKSFYNIVKNEATKIKELRQTESEEYFERGVRSLYSGSYKNAHEFFTVSLSDNLPGETGVMENLEDVGELIMEDYSLLSIYSNLVLVSSKLDKNEEVLAYLVAVNEIADPSPWIYYKMGKVYEKLGFWKQAHSRYSQAKTYGVNIPGLRPALGYVFKKMGRYSDSIAEFKNALDRDPKNPVLMYNLGIMYKKAQKTNMAKEQLARVKEIIKPGTKFYYTVEEHLANLPE